MYKLLLCWRYLRTRYIALASIVSVTLGVATMIVVNSVMAGFTHEMQNRIHGILSDVVVESHSLEGFHDPEWHMQEIRRVAGKYIAGMTPTVVVPAMLSYQFRGQWITRQVNFIGVDEATHSAVSDFSNFLQHPENRKRLSFELRDGGYDDHDHQSKSRSPERGEMRRAGWPLRRYHAEQAKRFAEFMAHGGPGALPTSAGASPSESAMSESAPGEPSPSGAGQGETGQGETGQGETGQDETGQDGAAGDEPGAIEPPASSDIATPESSAREREIFGDAPSPSEPPSSAVDAASGDSAPSEPANAGSSPSDPPSAGPAAPTESSDPLAADAIPAPSTPDEGSRIDPFRTRDPFGSQGAEPMVFDPASSQHTGVVLGISLASFRTSDGQDRFLLLPGSDVKITLPTAGTPPKAVSDNFTIVDFYESKMSEYDSSFVFAPLEKVQQLRGMVDPQSGVGNVTSIQIKLRNEADGPRVRDLLQATFPSELYAVQTWRDKQGPLLAAVGMETAILNVLLFMIIAVAGFGILAIFYMIVVEKTKDIGILKALGAHGRGIMGIFLGYGVSLGMVGSGAGMVIGLAFVANINRIARVLAAVTGREVFDPSIYYFQEIPTIVEPFTVVWIVGGAILIAVAAGVLPAYRAAGLHPVEALRYE